MMVVMETFRISEVGRQFGLSRSTLLYYDRIGLLRAETRTRADYRSYTPEDIERLERICALRETGLPLAEIARLLDTQGDDASILEKRLHAIGQEIDALKAQQRLIAGMIRTTASPPESSGLDAELWTSLRRACGIDEAALRRWHAEFERRSPQAHHDFLTGLGLSEKEVIQVRMLTRDVEGNRSEMEYFHELFDDLPRQGPGCADATLRALALASPLPPKPRVLDIGCGSGLPTRLLARRLRTRILAIDNHGPALERLELAATREHLAIETREMSMLDMPFDEASFDLLWAEGALFVIGLARGMEDFRHLLAPGGVLAFTEMCLFEQAPPAELRAWFDDVYPDIHTIEEVRALATESGYELVGSFELPESAWWDDYYSPMLERMHELEKRNAGIPAADAVYARCEHEVEMFWRHSRSYGYAFFVLRRRDDRRPADTKEDSR